ncbi:MAG: TauD/TfdA family dioxygenase [Myxococcota bacterium]
MQGISIRELDAPLGAEIDGLDPTTLRALDAEGLESIRSALHRHRLLLIRGTPRADADLVRFAERFGRLVTLYDHETTVPGFPAIVRVSNIETDGRPIGLAGSQPLPWHHDHSYLPCPARESFLEASLLPNDPPRTVFADMAMGLAALPAKLRERIRGLRAVHHIDERPDAVGDARRPTGTTPDYADATNVLAQDRIASQRAIHPVVVRHPESGVEALYVSPLATHSIVGMPAPEAHALLDELFERAIRPDHMYAHAWSPGDLVVWDTVATLHRRDGFDPAARRLMKQMSTACAEPLASTEPTRAQRR